MANEREQVTRQQDDVDALERAHDIRKFEINLTWKRATYVGAFQGFLFAALGVLVVNGNSDTDEVNFFKFVVSIVGVFLSGAWYLINQGSRYWQKYWEEKIMTLEKNYPDEHKTIEFINPFGYLPYAIGRTNMALSMFFLIIWAAIAALFLVQAIVTFECPVNIYTIAYVVLVIATAIALRECYFRLRKKHPK